MQITIEIDEKTIDQIDSIANGHNKTKVQYINDAIQKSLKDDFRKLDYPNKVKRFIESYEKFPQQPEEYEIWQDEQVWD